MIDFEFVSLRSVEELAEILTRRRCKLIAGGTDVIPRLRRSQFSSDCLVDISRLSDLNFIHEIDGQIQIGAIITHSELMNSSLLQQYAPTLIQAVSTIGCPQTRYRGTLGGNLANASPAADSAPPLLTLDAKAHLVSRSTSRTVSLIDLFIGPGKTVIGESEYIHHISFPCPAGRWGAAFYKLGKRNGMAISVVNGAAYLELDKCGLLQVVRIALGSVAPRPVRCICTEAYLVGKSPSPELFQQASTIVQQDIAPIDDLRASSEYRSHAAKILIQRILISAWKHADGRMK